MAGLVPAIHDVLLERPWMAGITPAMTTELY
jgi:hypothetical protein